MMTRRQGFTLVELLVALAVAGSLGVVIGRLLFGAQRLSRTQLEQSNLQENVRAGALIVPAELRELGYDSTQSALAVGNASDVTPDILEMTAHRIRIRAMRGFGLTCASAPYSTSNITIRLPWRGFRAPTADDDTYSSSSG